MNLVATNDTDGIYEDPEYGEMGELEELLTKVDKSEDTDDTGASVEAAVKQEEEIVITEAAAVNGGDGDDVNTFAAAIVVEDEAVNAKCVGVEAVKGDIMVKGSKANATAKGQVLKEDERVEGYETREVLGVKMPRRSERHKKISQGLDVKALNYKTQEMCNGGRKERRGMGIPLPFSSFPLLSHSFLRSLLPPFPAFLRCLPPAAALQAAGVQAACREGGSGEAGRRGVYGAHHSPCHHTCCSSAPPSYRLPTPPPPSSPCPISMPRHPLPTSPCMPPPPLALSPPRRSHSHAHHSPLHGVSPLSSQRRELGRGAPSLAAAPEHRLHAHIPLTSRYTSHRASTSWENLNCHACMHLMPDGFYEMNLVATNDMDEIYEDLEYGEMGELEELLTKVDKSEDSDDMAASVEAAVKQEEEIVITDAAAVNGGDGDDVNTFAAAIVVEDEAVNAKYVGVEAVKGDIMVKGSKANATAKGQVLKEDERVR
ncbi:unnamed protein product [Closterium sp. Naga37s-1]|nr:unnamed protein product [Closterium sp. Naga37s-1]